MEFMDFKENKQETITRLACCVVAALILYYAFEKYGDHLNIPVLDQYRPWLAQNKVQAIAIAAAVLYGVSLAVFPLEKKGPEVIPDPYCDGYEPVGGEGDT